MLHCKQKKLIKSEKSPLLERENTTNNLIYLEWMKKLIGINSRWLWWRRRIWTLLVIWNEDDSLVFWIELGNLAVKQNSNDVERMNYFWNNVKKIKRKRQEKI